MTTPTIVYENIVYGLLSLWSLYFYNILTLDILEVMLEGTSFFASPLFAFFGASHNL